MRILNLTFPIVLLACLGTVFPVAALAQERAKQEKQEQEEPKPLSFWMEKKIEYSQEMLRGLVGGDLEQVAEKAEQMRFLSKVEGWIRGKVPGYRAQSQVFQFANNEILRQARTENLEGTTMAFQQMTASCVSCHRMLRETNGNGGQAAGKKQAAD